MRCLNLLKYCSILLFESPVFVHTIVRLLIVHTIVRLLISAIAEPNNDCGSDKYEKKRERVKRVNIF